MFTQVKSPQDVFFSPQRLVVPLFQRPYVWSLERQWEPLWMDVRRLADKALEGAQAEPHFLGAIVVQQQQSEIGNLSVRTVIDGQQRLTTLQLLFDATYGLLVEKGLGALASQMENLVRNQDAYISDPSDRFKIWPTNRDRPAFEEVMALSRPDYAKLRSKESRISRAHRYFLSEVDQWLGEEDATRRAEALVSAMSHRLSLVVIDLAFDEDAQEIFETLNARGTPLTAADLIKNFVFQRLQQDDFNAEEHYEKYWRLFETPFWETEVTVGRVVYSRSSLFLTQWLVAMTGEEITVREVFSRFKRYTAEAEESISELLPRITAAAQVYQDFSQGAWKPTGRLSTIEHFVYRLDIINTETAKPFLIWLTDPARDSIDAEQFNKALNSLESWFVRRAIVKATTKAYNLLMAGLVREVEASDRQSVGDVVEKFLRELSGPNLYWPGDEVVLRYLTEEPVYRKLARAKLRMILEGVEDHRRGFSPGSLKTLSEQPVVRNECSIEHVMPQDWVKNWPGEEFDEDGVSRNDLVHRLGNLVLVTQSLNSTVSNGPWAEKKKALSAHATLLTTQDLLAESVSEWDIEGIKRRSRQIAEEIVEIWTVPEGHEGYAEAETASESGRVSVEDLIDAGLLTAGQKIFARAAKQFGQEALIAEDGGIFASGHRYPSPSAAARSVTNGQSVNGWWFWVTNLESMTALSELRDRYVELFGAQDTGDEEE